MQTRHQVPLEVILIRYWEEHAKAISSAEQARYALAKWSDHFSGADRFRADTANAWIGSSPIASE